MTGASLVDARAGRYWHQRAVAPGEQADRVSCSEQQQQRRPSASRSASAIAGAGQDQPGRPGRAAGGEREHQRRRRRARRRTRARRPGSTGSGQRRTPATATTARYAPALTRERVRRRRAGCGPATAAPRRPRRAPRRRAAAASSRGSREATSTRAASCVVAAPPSTSRSRSPTPTVGRALGEVHRGERTSGDQHRPATTRRDPHPARAGAAPGRRRAPSWAIGRPWRAIKPRTSDERVDVLLARLRAAEGPDAVGHAGARLPSCTNGSDFQIALPASAVGEHVVAVGGVGDVEEVVRRCRPRSGPRRRSRPRPHCGVALLGPGVLQPELLDDVGDQRALAEHPDRDRAALLPAVGDRERCPARAASLALPVGERGVEVGEQLVGLGLSCRPPVAIISRFLRIRSMLSWRRCR